MTTSRTVTAEQDPRYGDPGVPPTGWAEADDALRTAEVFWLTTVRPDGRPHTTPLIGLWLVDRLYFCTGPGEQKARNLGAGPHCTATTGSNELHGGTDLVISGQAVRITDDDLLHGVAQAYEAKYGDEWQFGVKDGYFVHGPGRAAVYELRPETVHAFAKDPYSQTRFRFA